MGLGGWVGWWLVGCDRKLHVSVSRSGEFVCPCKKLFLDQTLRGDRKFYDVFEEDLEFLVSQNLWSLARSVMKVSTIDGRCAPVLTMVAGGRTLHQKN